MGSMPEGVVDITDFEEIPSPLITLDVAQVLNNLERNPALSINHLLDLRSSTHPDLRIVGFPLTAKYHSESGTGIYFTFRSLQRASSSFAEHLSAKCSLPRRHSTTDQPLTIGLLAESGSDFLITVLACLRLGLTVLLLAPQLPIQQVCHLLKETRSSHLLLFGSVQVDADEIQRPLPELKLLHLERDVTSKFSYEARTNSPEYHRFISYEEEGSMGAVIFHSSGTTGLPKPIVTLHKDLTQILPLMSGDRNSVFSFSTTPLYHGGFQDLFRALNSLSPICFFPLDSRPVTYDNISQSLMTCSRSSDMMMGATGSQDVNVLLTVPYILQIIKSHPDGISLLQKMKLVCFGGASLDNETGDELVKKDIKLVSRYGSSESGFLLSSYREFQRDQDWNWLREPATPIGEQARTFRRVDDHTYELIIKKGWPQMAVQNLPDGDFATGDLFEPHPSKPRIWRYLGRADDIIVLANGEKLNPNRAESMFKTEFDQIKQGDICSALMFGSRRTHCGLLVLLDRKVQQSTSWKSKWQDVLRKVNHQLPTFARIWSEMVIFLKSGTDFWPTSSKGLVQRNRIVGFYRDRIESLYSSPSSDGPLDTLQHDYRSVTPEELRIIIKRTVSHSLSESHRFKVQHSKGTEVLAVEEDEQELFELGLNSLNAIRIKTHLQRILNVETGLLPLNLVYDNATVSRLVNFFMELKTKPTSCEPEESHTTDRMEISYNMMRSLVKKFSRFKTPPAQLAVTPQENEPQNAGHTIVLTGATGSLGAHILNELLKRDSEEVFQVICLIRQNDEMSASNRVIKSFKDRGLPGNLLSENHSRLRFLNYYPSEESLGLSKEEVSRITSCRQLVIIHSAWMVDFLKPLSSFEKENLRGLRSLLDLFGQSIGGICPAHITQRPKFIFCSSLSSVSNTKHLLVPSEGSFDETIDEVITHDPRRALDLGYAQSKWVAEEVCDQFVKFCSKDCHIESSMIDVTVMRIGQLSGDSVNGIWNATEYWPLLIKSCKFTGCLPILDGYPSWLPVDVCAQAIVEHILPPDSPRINSYQKRNVMEDEGNDEVKEVNVYHIFNTNTAVSWNKIIEMINQYLMVQKDMVEINSVDGVEWFKKLSESEPDPKLNPSRKLLAVWEDHFTHKKKSIDRTQKCENGNRALALALQDDAFRNSQDLHENAHIGYRRAQRDLDMSYRSLPISQDWLSKMLEVLDISYLG